MFSPKLNTPRARYQSLGIPNSGSQSRKRSSIYTPQKKSFSTPAGKNQSLNASILQTSRVYEEFGQHRLESYGQALPILVSEALALRDKHIEPTVKITPAGWAWMVCNRRLLVWMFKVSAHGKTLPCHELSLSPSGLSHKAGLVTVIPHPGDSNTAACLAVSPEGAVRYWPNIIHESSFSEVSTELKGEECTSVTYLQTNQCVVSTTTSSLILATLPAGQSGLLCRLLRAPQGRLKGIGRRVSTLIFGSAATQSTGESFHQLSSGEMLDERTSAFYVLCGSSLQKWAVCGDQDKMLYQCNVEQFVSDCIGHEVWHQGADQIPTLKTWLLDMEVTGDGVVVLAAGMNPAVSNNLYYCIGVLHTAGVDSPRSFLSFNVVRFTNVYLEEDEAQLLSYRLMRPNPTNSSAFLYHNKSILCTSVSSSQQAVDKLEFYASGDRILGSGHCDRSAVFFSSKRGFITVKSVSVQMDSSLNESVAEAAARMEMTMAVAASERLEEMSMSEDETARLKAAFLHSTRGEMAEVMSLVNELFPPGMPSTDTAGSTLDRLVSKLSQEMIDDFPASDPRWAESHNSVGSSVSLILIHQLEDKLKAHEYFIQFVKSAGLWDRLGCMHMRKTITQTSALLCEHAEKLVAARALRELHTQHQTLVDQAIGLVLEMRGENIPSSGLTAADIFYREVSRVDDILVALVELEARKMNTDLSPREMVSLVGTINSIIGGMLLEAVQYRQAKVDVFQATSRLQSTDAEYVPWTAADGPRGARALLAKQHSVTVSNALTEAQDSQERGLLFQQLLELTSGLLDGYKSQLDSIKMSSDHPMPRHSELLHHYEEERTKLIAPFIKQKQYERAAALGEKYQDFSTLIQVCEETDNQDRLHRYMNQFQARGFADFVFKWYLDEGKRGKLMASSLASHPQLSRFLQAGENRYMSWLHDINTSNFLNAHKTLFELGIDEKESAAKKKTLLSLSKLAALASEDPPEFVHNNLEAITEEHDLLFQQEQLPPDVLDNLGLAAEHLRVYSPKELIELYIGDFNNDSDEFQFKRALDLLCYIDKKDPEYAVMLVQIWCRAILRDDWSCISPDDHLEGCRDTMFFKTVELVHSTGMDLNETLPGAEAILSHDLLAHAKDNANFQYLIKACFEQIRRVLKLS